MCESPTMEFGEGDPQVGPLHHGQVCRVAAIQHIHHPHLVKNSLQHRPKDSQYYQNESALTVQVENLARMLAGVIH